MRIEDLWPLIVDPNQLAETQSVEYKSAETFDANRRGLVRCCLSMCNTDDGGVIVVGVRDDNGRFTLCGVTEELVKTYKLQTLGHQLASYGSAGLTVKASVKVDNGLSFIVIEVSPFAEYPVIAVKPLDPQEKGGIKEGVVYYRNEAAEDKPASDIDFKRIMDRMVRLTLTKWGPSVSGCQMAGATNFRRNDEADFRAELGGL